MPRAMLLQPIQSYQEAPPVTVGTAQWAAVNSRVREPRWYWVKLDWRVPEQRQKIDG